MKHRKRNMITALAAAMLLTLTAVGSAAFAQDGRGGAGDPSGSARPQATHPAKPTKAPRTIAKFDCSTIVAATPTPTVAPTAAPSGAAAGKAAKGWGRMGRDWPAIVKLNLAKFCSLEAAQKTGADQVNGLLKQLQALENSVAKSSLSDADKAALKAEIDAVMADLTSLKAKIAAETTADAARADLALVKQQGKLVRGVKLQVLTILGSLRVLDKAGKLETQIAAFEAQILAAPSGIDTAAAQKYLDDLKAQAASATASATPLRAQLMGLTLDQLKAGKADPTLAAAFMALHKASWSLWRASQDARIVTWILAGKPGFQGKHPKPSATPSATPTATPVPTV